MSQEEKSQVSGLLSELPLPVLPGAEGPAMGPPAEPGGEGMRGSAWGTRCALVPAELLKDE